jgi:RNA polymerase sigma factor (sigma-70 family)
MDLLDNSVIIKEQLEKFIEKYKKEMRNPLIKGFLEDEKNRELYEKAILESSEENKRVVEEAFAKYYEEIRRTAYFSNMIKFIGIDFDKKIRKHNNRFPLTIDQPLLVESDEIATMKDMIVDPTGPYLYEGEETLKSQITDKKLYKALEVLTEKQVHILNMKFVQKLSNVEIAKIVQSTPQNVSNILKKSLKKLKTQMDGDNQ